jgi:hypothetical protein
MILYTNYVSSIHCKKYLFWKYSFQYLGNVDQL